jgi:hypothetical protein
MIKKNHGCCDCVTCDVTGDATVHNR